MATERRSRADVEAELNRYRDEWNRLSGEMADYEADPTSQPGAASTADRINRGNKTRLAQMQRTMDELNAILATLPAEEAVQTDNATRDTPPHPILAVEGRYARVADIVAAKLPDGDNAFSDSTRAALTRARLVPIGETEQGDPVIGPASLLRACLGGASAVTPSRTTTESELLAAHLLARRSWDESFRVRLRVPSSPAPSQAVHSAASPAANAPAEIAGHALDRVIADGPLTQVLAEAARLAVRLTPGQARVDIRHALLAALRTPQAQRVFFDLEVVGQDPAAFFRDLFGALEGYLRQHHDTDSREVLSTVLAELAYDPAAAPPSPARRSESVYVADSPAETLAQDRLGVADEARALAEVMCLREPGPPLAIGLFGDWGSGKSTFMNMIEAAIEELTVPARDDEIARRTLVGKVVHVKFNAWHYNDANLWASLTAEFFSQLRAGGHGGQVGADYAALVRSVLARVGALEGEAAKQGTLAALARRELDSLGTELDGLEAQRGGARIAELAAAVTAMVPRADDAQVSRVHKVMDALGHPVDIPAEKQSDPKAVRDAVERSITVLETEVERAARFPGRVMAIGRALFQAVVAREWVTVAVLGFGILVAAATILLIRELDLDRVRAWLIAGAGMLCGVVPILYRGYHVVEPIFRAAADFKKRLQKSEAQLAADIEKKRNELGEAKKKLGAATTIGAQNEAEAARLRQGTPEQVFDYFLNVAQDTQGFERELGTVSRVRRAFEQLDAIFSERERLRRDGGARTAAGGAEELRRLDGVTAGIDRVVLYIDDLDRCQVHQVVRVLEAVHLLLAFPLFVVVVGVDARWLHQSLLEFYNRQFGARAGDADPGTDRRPPVRDYLEKIFQIPVQLRRLDLGKDGHFRGYLDSVVGPVAPGQDAAAQQSREGEHGQGQAAGHAGGIPTVDVKLKAVAESVREAVERITLRKAEVDLMEALAPFHGKSPRAVKRFVNVYRLIRGLRRGDALVRFLEGAGDEPPTYPAVLFWLAVEAGRGSEASALYREALCSPQMDSLDVLATALERSNGTESNAYAALRQSMDSDSAKICAEALKVLARALPRRAGVASLLATYAETRRFAVQQG